MPTFASSPKRPRRPVFGPGSERVGLTCTAVMVKSASQSLVRSVTTGAGAGWDAFLGLSCLLVGERIAHQRP